MVCLSRPYLFKYFKDCLPQILLGSFILEYFIPNTVTGESWMNTYIDSLVEAEKVKVRRRDGKNFYHFGDSNTVSAIKIVDIPIIIGDKRVTLNTNVDQNDIQPLLLWKAVKTTIVTLSFKNNTVVFGEPEKIWTLRSTDQSIQ